jgi:hypothetical protein
MLKMTAHHQKMNSTRQHGQSAITNYQLNAARIQQNLPIKPQHPIQPLVEKYSNAHTTIGETPSNSMGPKALTTDRRTRSTLKVT